ncbi:hypothetical protein [Zooshikella sp. RANM57]|uniref:hypothetical protein n=1 Tax=Zooshikella sp. RANM57 TaxID=3425863 RepID=UPI003D6DB361
MAAPDPVRMVDFYAQKLQDIKQQITDLNQEKASIEQELINLVGAQEEGSSAHETTFFKVTTTGKIDRKVITKHLSTVKEVVTPEIFNSIFRLNIASDQPLEKLNEDPSWYECKLCDHHAICHGEQVPTVNCRTCLHASAVDQGQWHCARFNLLIPENNQRVGCQAHLFIPDLIQRFAEVIDSGEYWIRYRLKKSGECFITGEAPEQFNSRELRAVEDKTLLTDNHIQTLRTTFNAQLVEDAA